MSGVVVPLKRKAEDDGYRCICGFDHDDGFSIACDSCQRWSHAACYDIVNGAVPEEWKCWSCKPRPVNRDAAERLQRVRQQRAKDGRRMSPGIDRKHRRIRHREVAETDEPSTHAFVPIAADIVHPDAREKLRRYAHHWRGITALADDDDSTTTPVALPHLPHLLPPPTTLKQLPPQLPLSPFTNPSVLPPAYAVHTAGPVRSHEFIAPFTSNVVPSSSYLADPLNAYAHLGMPKPFVHLIGPPLNVALDARQAGDNSRYLRSGCRPNAVLRPVLCPPDSLSFGVFATRDLKPNEEVILGWEWDDGNVVHSLPALIQSPHAFPSQQVQHLRRQMADILHALSSNFTTCACGSKARDCVLNQMAAFVEDDPSKLLSPHSVDLGPLIGKQRGFRTRERIPSSSGMAGVEMFSLASLRKGKAKERPNGLVCDESISRSTLLSIPSSTAPPRMRRTSSNSASSSSDRPLPELDPPDDDEGRVPPKMRKRWKKQQRRIKTQSPAGSLLSIVSADEVSFGLGIRMDGTPIPSSSKITLRDMPPPPLPATSHLTSIDFLSPSTGLSRLTIIEATPSPYQSWTPFERKETVPTDNNAVDLPHSSSSPSSHSPHVSISISPRRSRSRTRSRSPRSPCNRHPSPTSTAITTPPSPRDSKLPDVLPPLSSPESAEHDEGLVQPPDDEEVIRDSPESPPPEPMDDPSSPMSPATPTPPPPPMLPLPPVSPLEGKSLGNIEVDQEKPKEIIAMNELEEGELVLPGGDPLPTLQYPSQSPPPPSWYSRKTTPPPCSGPSFIDLTVSPAEPSHTTTESTNPISRTVDSVSPPPPPAPSVLKVKMSLKDFAARKKKLREENPGQVGRNENDGLNSPIMDSPILGQDLSMSTSAAVVQAINSNDKSSSNPPLKFTPRITTSTSLPVKLHSEMRHVGGTSSSSNQCDSKSPHPTSTASTSSPSLSLATHSIPTPSAAPALSSTLLAKPSAGSPSIYTPSTFESLISSSMAAQRSGPWSDIVVSVQEKEEREQAKKEREERERKAREERERVEKKAAQAVHSAMTPLPRLNSNDAHELRLDILEEELKKEKEKTKQLMDARKKGEMDTWEKLKLKSFLEGSTTAEKVKVKQAVVEQHSLSPAAALRPLVNSKVVVPGVIVPRMRSLRHKKSDELVQKQASLPSNSPITPTPSSSSSATTVPPPPPPSISVPPPPSSATLSVTPRSHSPTNLTTKRPVPMAPRAMTNLSYTGGAPQVSYRPNHLFSGVAPPTGPRALKASMSSATSRVIGCVGPARVVNTPTLALPLPSSVHPPQPKTSPPPQPPPPPTVPLSAVGAGSPRQLASNTPPPQPTASADLKGSVNSGSAECVRPTPLTTNATSRLQTINTRIPAICNTSKSNTPNSSTPVTPTATPTPTSIPPSAGLPPRPPVTVTTPSHHLHRDPISSMMAMGMGSSNGNGAGSTKRMGSDWVRFDRDRDRDRDRERSNSKEREREKEWDRWTPRPRRDHWDSWPRTSDKY